jgi:hypothetical protein
MDTKVIAQVVAKFFEEFDDSTNWVDPLESALYRNGFDPATPTDEERNDDWFVVAVTDHVSDERYSVWSTHEQYQRWDWRRYTVEEENQ